MVDTWGVGRATCLCYFTDATRCAHALAFPVIICHVDAHRLLGADRLRAHVPPARAVLSLDSFSTTHSIFDFEHVTSLL